MAAEIPCSRGERCRFPVSFNEAAANGRGNRQARAGRNGRASASMRPRRMAAEIERRENPEVERPTASMRPRRMAAEIPA